MTDAAELLAEQREVLDRALERARDLGFLGRTSIDDHVAHASGFAAAWATSRSGPGDRGSPERVLDLGSGGGLPGLVLAILWPEATVTLLDANERRTHFLRGVSTEEPWRGRVTVVEGRAEQLAHELALRAMFDLVVSRSFGPPSAVAECGGPFLTETGELVVSEPPDSTGERWSASGLAELGLGRAETVAIDGRGWVVIPRTGPMPARYPRRVGLPTKRPLFG
ncbi:MAG: RsmG family class I SAM-dependent methyltransferase [Actinomycetota bacterium]|nr:RsmG family class I SAM-dependent methyltransferase [Actinomycetota bacterium]